MSNFSDNKNNLLFTVELPLCMQYPATREVPVAVKTLVILRLLKCHKAGCVKQVEYNVWIAKKKKVVQVHVSIYHLTLQIIIVTTVLELEFK